MLINIDKREYTFIIVNYYYLRKPLRVSGKFFEQSVFPSAYIYIYIYIHGYIYILVNSVCSARD